MDVAGRLGVSKASVSKALSKLSARSSCTCGTHDVRLTAEGRAVAERVSERHAFFRALPAAGVEAVVADEEACRLEHCLCEDSFRKLVTALDARG
ncbi:MAG: metal-dependent transcriptional regulator [Eggerthella lenta]